VKRTKSIKIINLIILFLLLLGILSFSSYFLSKRAAEQFVGETLQYFPLSRAVLLPPPISRNGLVWWFTFSDTDPHTFDDGFEIYTNVLGEVVRTNPTDIWNRLREWENLEVHPYSPEAKEKFKRQQIKKRQVAHEKGVRLFEASSFKEVFKEHFTLSDIEAPENTSTHGVYFSPGPEWWATLSPKKIYPLPCQVSAIFPIKDNSKIEATITPREIEGAFDMCLSHPYVLNYIAGNTATGIRLRITGDRLHWDTPELQEFLVELKDRKAEKKELRNWARITIDDEKNQLFSFYLNSNSGELIYEDSAVNCSKPTLVPIKATD